MENSIIQRYKLLGGPTGSSHNFYFCLAAKIMPVLLDKRHSNTKNDQRKYVFDVLGNRVVFEFPKLSLSINGVPLSNIGKGVEWFKSCIEECFSKEAEGSLVINRPGNRTRREDRNEFNKAEGTFFTTLYKPVVYASGSKDFGAARKSSVRNAFYLTDKEYHEYADGNADFEKHENAAGTYWTNKKAITVDLTYTRLRADQLAFAIQNYSRQETAAERVLNYPELREIVSRPKSRYYVVVSGDEAFLAVTSDNHAPEVKNLRMHYWEAIIKGLSKETKPSANADYVNYKAWLSETNKKASKSSWEEYCKSGRTIDSRIMDSVFEELPLPWVGCMKLIKEYDLEVWLEGITLHIYPDTDEQANKLIEEIEEIGYTVQTIEDEGTITRLDVSVEN